MVYYGNINERLVLVTEHPDTGLNFMDTLEIIIAKIQFAIPSLPKGEKSAAVYIAEHLDIVAEQNLSMISSAIGVSEATIIRLCKRIGYDGFLEFRRNVRDSKIAAEAVIKGSRNNRETIAADIRKVMSDVISENSEIMKNVLALVTDEYGRAVDSICNARVINMFGNGDAIIPCELLAIKLMKIGVPCWVVNDQDLQLLSASAMSEGDVALAVSHTGRSKSVVEALKKAKQRGAITIGITGAVKSPLLKYCDIVLHTGSVSAASGGDIIARRIAEQIILETLYIKIMSRMEEKVKDRKMEGAVNINQIYKIAEEDEQKDM